MLSLYQLPKDDEALLIALPYRVGIWMSHADDAGGEQDDLMEAKALTRLLKFAVKSKKVSPFVMHIATETLKQNDDWPVWAENTMNIERDCERIHQILVDSVTEKERRAYKQFLLKIGEVVAGAYGEFDDDAEDEEAGLLGKLLGAVNSGRADEDEFANVSPAEEVAISSLKSILLQGEKA